MSVEFEKIAMAVEKTKTINVSDCKSFLFIYYNRFDSHKAGSLMDRNDRLLRNRD